MDWSESTLVKMPHCLKSHVAARLVNIFPPVIDICTTKISGKEITAIERP